MSRVDAHVCRHCDREYCETASLAVEPERFCSEDCENEYEIDVCPECNEELDPDIEHECPMVPCEDNPEHGEYNENEEQDGCPVCLDEYYEKENGE